MTVCRTRCVTETFKFKRRNNVRALVVSVFIKFFKRNRIVTCCYNDCTILLCNDFFFLVKLDGACCTCFFTETTNVIFTVCKSLHVETVCSINVCYLWNSLGKWNINCLTVVEAKVECVWNLLVRTLFDTSTTTCTLCFINIAWVTFDIDFEVSDIS